MEDHICSIVSPHLLDALAVSEDPESRRLARKTLEHGSHIQARRKNHFDSKALIHGRANRHPIAEGFLPDQLPGSASQPGSTTVEPSHDVAKGGTPDMTQKPPAGRPAATPAVVTFPTAVPPPAAAPQTSPDTGSSEAANVTTSSGSGLNRKVYDMQHLVQMDGRVDDTYGDLPGKLVRSEGEAPIADEYANQAYDNCAIVVDFYRDMFGYTFSDSQTVTSSIHFESGFQNAQWIGGFTRQMIYGDGGKQLHNFTACMDVIGHELMVRFGFLVFFCPEALHC